MAYMGISIPVREIKTHIPLPHNDVEAAPPWPPYSMLCLLERQGFPQKCAFIFPAGTAPGVAPGAIIEHGGEGAEITSRADKCAFLFPEPVLQKDGERVNSVVHVCCQLPLPLLP